MRPRLAQKKIAEGKTSYELNWKVKVMMGKKTRVIIAGHFYTINRQERGVPKLKI